MLVFQPLIGSRSECDIMLGACLHCNREHVGPLNLAPLLKAEHHLEAIMVSTSPAPFDLHLKKSIVSALPLQRGVISPSFSDGRAAPLPAACFDISNSILDVSAQTGLCCEFLNIFGNGRGGARPLGEF